MDLPELTHDEYDKLVALESKGQEEGWELDTYWLQALNPYVLFADNWNETPKRGLRIQFLNVVKPHLYRKGRFLFIVVPKADLTYDSISEIFPNATNIDLWGFVMKDSWYDDMDECNYYFLNGDESYDGRRPLAPFNLSDWSTH